MKEYFRYHKFKPEARATVDLCRQIVQSFHSQGLRLTLRQLFYQLVVRNAVKNTEKDYKRLSPLLSDARLVGFIDWQAIEDRIRRPWAHSEFADLDELVQAALDSYRLPRWSDQPNYVELWVEKDALAGVLQPLADEFHVTLMVNRGYSSQSAMYDAAKRFLAACWGDDLAYETMYDRAVRDRGTNGLRKEHIERLKEVKHLDPESLHEGKRRPILLYLGDHDPSGEDMVRDIGARLAMFGVKGLEVRKLALTMDQIAEHNPPPNPAKMSDPRAADYVAKHGNESWEVDALGPDVLDRIIRDAFEGLVDRGLMRAIVRKEERDKAQLRRAVRSVRRKK